MCYSKIFIEFLRNKRQFQDTQREVLRSKMFKNNLKFTRATQKLETNKTAPHP